MDAKTLDKLEAAMPHGLARATTVEDLRWAMTPTYGGYPGERQIRKGLEQLVMERDIPVVTLHPQGVFIATSPEEVWLGVEDIKRQVMPQLKRMSKLKRLALRMTPKETLF